MSASLVEGQVVSASTGEPLKKAHVGLRVEGGGENAGTTTDQAGRFAVTVTSPGKYRLYAERNGYLHGEYGARSAEKAGAALAIVPGQHFQDMTIRLTPQGVIAGRVVDEDGEPLLNADVQALELSYSRGTRQMVPVWIGTTNDAGEFRAFGLSPGRYFIGATYRANGSPAALRKAGESGADMAYPLTYYPGSTDPRSAGPIQVSPGAQIRNIEIALMPRPSVHLRGRVMSAVVNSGGNTTVVLVPRDGTAGYLNTKAATIKDDKGNFEIAGVTPGSYELLATWSGGNRRYTARQNVEVGGVNIDDINLTINTSGDLAGQVRLAEGNVALDAIEIWLEPRDASGSMSHAKVIRGGVFSIQYVTAGTYNLNISGVPEGYYLKSARIGRDDVLERGVNLEQGVTGALDIVLSPRAGQLDGVVSNDSQNPSIATVVLVPEGSGRSQPHLYKTTTTDQYGHFMLQDISPGDYRVFAWEDVEGGAYQDAEFLARFEAKGERVSIAEGGHQSLQLKLIPAE